MPETDLGLLMEEEEDGGLRDRIFPISTISWIGLFCTKNTQEMAAHRIMYVEPLPPSDYLL